MRHGLLLPQLGDRLRELKSACVGREGDRNQTVYASTTRSKRSPLSTSAGSSSQPLPQTVSGNTDMNEPGSHGNGNSREGVRRSQRTSTPASSSGASADSATRLSWPDWEYQATSTRATQAGWHHGPALSTRRRVSSPNRGIAYAS